MARCAATGDGLPPVLEGPSLCARIVEKLNSPLAEYDHFELADSQSHDLVWRSLSLVPIKGVVVGCVCQVGMKPEPTLGLDTQQVRVEVVRRD
ncbi:hypothetical protein D3C71_1857410 [compost metagenome]